MGSGAKIDNFYRGDTRTFKFEIVDDADLPVDITGWSIWFTMKDDLFKTDEEAAVQKFATMPNDIDSQNGIGFLILESTDTDIDPGAYFYDFQRVLAPAVMGDPPQVSTFMFGKVKVLDDVTKSV